MHFRDGQVSVGSLKVWKEDSSMEFALPLDQMTTEDKLAAMEQLWEDLSSSPESVPSPSWHEDVLSAREKRVREGSAEFVAFDLAKDRIKKSTSDDR